MVVRGYGGNPVQFGQVQYSSTVQSLSMPNLCSVIILIGGRGGTFFSDWVRLIIGFAAVTDPLGMFLGKLRVFVMAPKYLGDEENVFISISTVDVGGGGALLL